MHPLRAALTPFLFVNMNASLMVIVLEKDANPYALRTLRLGFCNPQIVIVVMVA